MRPIVRVIGKVLRLVGISSPEDSLVKPATASDPPSWRTPRKRIAQSENPRNGRPDDEDSAEEAIKADLGEMTQ